MKKLIAFLLLLSSPLYAAMSDAAAMNQAKILWGPLASISTVRDIASSNWTREIGIKSIGCDRPFTPLGSGFNTWDAAFMNFAANPPIISGPFKGLVDFEATAWDNVAVTKFEWWIDGVSVDLNIQLPPAPMWQVSKMIDTTTLTNGLHVLCMAASDGAGLIGRSIAHLFSIDQTVAELRPVFFVGPMPVNFHPSISKAVSKQK